MEKQIVLFTDIIVAATINKAVFLSKFSFKGQRGITFIVNMLNSRPHHLDKRMANSHLRHVHSYTMCLHYSCFSITINNQSRQIIALAVY